jgi:hypothetical protein
MNPELLNILLVTLFLFLITLFFAFRDYPLNKPEPKKVVTDVVTIETFENDIDKKEKIKKMEIMKEVDSMNLDGNKGFCQIHSSHSSSSNLEESCNNLTKRNCNDVDCCVWTSNNKCSSGNIDGPIFKTDKNGNEINIDYFYYKNKCYGKNCPNV